MHLIFGLNLAQYIQHNRGDNMGLTKEIKIGKIEIVGEWNIQVATDTIIKEDKTQISKSRHRHVLNPDSDISKEASEVQAVANAVWTDTVKANYKTWKESQER